MWYAVVKHSPALCGFVKQRSIWWKKPQLTVRSVECDLTGELLPVHFGLYLPLQLPVPECMLVVQGGGRWGGGGGEGEEGGLW